MSHKREIDPLSLPISLSLSLSLASFQSLEKLHLFICLTLFGIYLCPPVFLHRQRWEPGWRSPNDLFEIAECHSQAGLHLHLPEFSRLVWQCVWLLPARPPLQGQQRRGADTSQKPLHQRGARRMPGQCGNIMISSHYNDWTECFLYCGREMLLSWSNLRWHNCFFSLILLSFSLEKVRKGLFYRSTPRRQRYCPF